LDFFGAEEVFFWQKESGIKCEQNLLQIFVPDIYIYKMISFEKKSLLKTVDGLYLGPEGFRYSFLPLFYSVVSFVAHILLENTFFFYRRT